MSAAVKRLASASFQVSQPSVPDHRHRLSDARLVVGVGDRGEVGAVGRRSARDESDDLVGVADVERNPRDVPRAGAEQGSGDGRRVVLRGVDLHADLGPRGGGEFGGGGAAGAEGVGVEERDRELLAVLLADAVGALHPAGLVECGLGRVDIGRGAVAGHGVVRARRRAGSTVSRFAGRPVLE